MRAARRQEYLWLFSFCERGEVASVPAAARTLPFTVRASSRHRTGADQTSILGVAIVLGYQDVGATLAFFQRSDITDEVVDA